MAGMERDGALHVSLGTQLTSVACVARIRLLDCRRTGTSRRLTAVNPKHFQMVTRSCIVSGRARIAMRTDARNIVSFLDQTHRCRLPHEN